MKDAHRQLPWLLAAAERAAPVEAVDVVAEDLRQRFGARELSFLLLDVAGKALTRLAAVAEVGTGQRQAERVTLRDSIYEKVLRTQQLHEEETSRGCRVLAPITNRGEAIGTLEFLLPATPNDAVVVEVKEVAHALAYIVIANGRFTDLYTRGRRSHSLSLAAEIQYQLLPPSLSCEAAEFALCGDLEPSEDISGDTFDYILDHDALYMSMTDTMGHNVDSALLATILVGALRGARREGADLLAQAKAADRALMDHGPPGHATGQLVRINLRNGQAGLLNAGHPWPLRMRDGKVEEIVCEVDRPFGLPLTAANPHRVQDLDLRPGDRLILLTDGMLERNATKVNLRELVKNTAHLHPRETAVFLTTAVLDAADGHLEDDATVMCLDWYGPQKARRHVSYGANIQQASPEA